MEDGNAGGNANARYGKKEASSTVLDRAYETSEETLLPACRPVLWVVCSQKAKWPRPGKKQDGPRRIERLAGLC